MTKIGLIINPVAGIGGKVGLKGSDGKETQARARELGAVPESSFKAKKALDIIAQRREQVEIITYPGEMGETLSAACGFPFITVLGQIVQGETTAADTQQAAKDLLDAGADIILFAGGDGTARNIMDAVGQRIPVIGIPAGCKIYSAVYAINPRKAGELVVKFVDGQIKEQRKSEVLDIDENLFRQNVVEAKLYGYLLIPNQRQMTQNLKSGGGTSEAACVEMLANYVAGTMEKDVLYLVGSGSTVDVVMQKLGLKNTLLGVDLVYNNDVIASDVTEKEILAALDEFPQAKVLVTIIGGQGYLFGRGNQQLSASVLSRIGKENIIVAAAKAKLLDLFGQTLYIDTGDEKVNQSLSGYYRIIVGYEDHMMFKASD